MLKMRKNNTHDAFLIEILKNLPRLHTPNSVIRRLYTQLKEVESGKKAISFCLWDFFRFRKSILITIVLTLVISVPLTLFTASLIERKNREQTTYIVRFLYENSEAKKVQVIGDFNYWSKEGLGMRKIGDSAIWMGELRLKGGIYKYVFLIDDSEWQVDPSSSIRVTDNFGNESSLIVLSNDQEVYRNL
jgi:hypothetical protein